MVASWPNLMCFSPLNLQPECLEKNKIDGENVKYCSKMFQNKTQIT